MSLTEKTGEQCWYCREASAEESAAAPVQLSNATGKLTVRVPRCQRCASAHQKADLRLTLIMLPGLLVALVAAFPVYRALSERGMTGIYALAFIIVVMVPVAFLGLYMLGAWWAKSGLPAGVAPDSAARDHPVVAQLLLEGYSMAGEPRKQAPDGAGKTEVQADTEIAEGLSPSDQGRAR